VFFDISCLQVNFRLVILLCSDPWIGTTFYPCRFNRSPHPIYGYRSQ